MSQPPRYPFRETTLGQHARRQHGVRRRQTRADDEGRLEPRAQDGVDERGRHEPAEGHDGPQHHADALPVAGEVALGQLDADGEALQGDDQPRRLLGDVVGEPLEGADEVGALGAKGDADEGGQGRFREVQAVADEGREEGVDEEEGGEDEEDEVGGGEFEVFAEP